MKPNVYKCLMMDAIVKALDIALDNKEFNSYFEKNRIKILGIEGIGIKKNKKEGLVVSFKDLDTDEIKHAEIKSAIKTSLYEEFTEYMDYEKQVKIYEETTGTKIKSVGKNKVTQNFEILSENIKLKIDDVNKLAADVLD